MKVALRGKTFEIFTEPIPLADPGTVPVYAELKALLEEEFKDYFDYEIKIKNWNYVFQRLMAYRVA